jgi:hypothetical protein
MAFTKICIGISSKDVVCSVKIPDEREYCSVYHEHYQELINKGHTKDAINLLPRCIRCKKHQPNTCYKDNYKTCENCINYRKSRTKIDEKCYTCETNNAIRINNGIHKGKNNKKYCELHIMNMKYDNLVLDGNNLCEGYRKTCISIVDTNELYCEECNNKKIEVNLQETQRRKENREEFNNKNCCGECGSKLDDNDKEFKYCSKCRNIRSIREKDQRKRGIRKDKGLTVERKMAKQEKIKEDRKKNPSKYKYADKLAKARMIVLQEHLYFDKNKKRTQQIRETQREMMSDEEYEQYKKLRRNNIYSTLKYYKYRANKNKYGGQSWDDNIDTIVLSMFKQKCFYCGEFAKIGEHNGIDRLDNSKGYTLDNIQTCCEFCNISKGCVDVDIFLMRVEHILTYRGLIDGNLYNNIFSASKNITYNTYRSRANIRNIDFAITETEYIDIKNKKCYLCGSGTSSIHVNGIDRIDSSKGYTVNNSISCCSDCNYHKHKYSLQYFLDKFQKIYDTNYETLNLLYNTKNLTIRKNVGFYFLKNGNYFKYKFNIGNLAYGEWDYVFDEENKSFEFHNIANNKYTKTNKINVKRNCYDFEYLLISQSRDNSINYDFRTLCETNNCVVRYDSDILLHINKSTDMIITLLLDDNNQTLGIKIEYGFTNNNNCNTINKCNTDCFKFIISQITNNDNDTRSYSGMKHISKNTNKTPKVSKVSRDIRQDSITRAKELLASDKRKKILEQLIISEDIRNPERINLEAFISSYETKINKDKLKEINDVSDNTKEISNSPNNKQNETNKKEINNTPNEINKKEINIFDNINLRNYDIIEKIIINSKSGKIIDIQKKAF